MLCANIQRKTTAKTALMPGSKRTFKIGNLFCAVCTAKSRKLKRSQTNKINASKDMIQKTPRHSNNAPNHAPKGTPIDKAIGCPTPAIAKARPW